MFRAQLLIVGPFAFWRIVLGCGFTVSATSRPAAEAAARDHLEYHVRTEVERYPNT